jgi:hypothetical protein
MSIREGAVARAVPLGWPRSSELQCAGSRFPCADETGTSGHQGGVFSACELLRLLASVTWSRCTLAPNLKTARQGQHNVADDATGTLKFVTEKPNNGQFKLRMEGCLSWSERFGASFEPHQQAYSPVLNQGYQGTRVSVHITEYQESRSGMGASGVPDIRESGPKCWVSRVP